MLDIVVCLPSFLINSHWSNVFLAVGDDVVFPEKTWEGVCSLQEVFGDLAFVGSTFYLSEGRVKGLDCPAWHVIWSVVAVLVAWITSGSNYDRWADGGMLFGVAFWQVTGLHVGVLWNLMCISSVEFLPNWHSNSGQIAAPTIIWVDQTKQWTRLVSLRQGLSHDSWTIAVLVEWFTIASVPSLAPEDTHTSSP